MPNETKTPRTDANEHGPGKGGFKGHCNADFARTLELELQQSQAACAEMREKLELVLAQFDAGTIDGMARGQLRSLIQRTLEERTSGQSILEELEAWKLWARHQDWCRTCAEGSCEIGQDLKSKVMAFAPQ